MTDTNVDSWDTKGDLRKACEWIHNAEKLAKRHLRPYYYPIIMDSFQYLIVNLNKLANEGLPRPGTKT